VTVDLPEAPACKASLDLKDLLVFPVLRENEVSLDLKVNKEILVLLATLVSPVLLAFRVSLVLRALVVKSETREIKD